MESKARLVQWIVTRATRDTGMVDRLCRRLLARTTRLPPDQDFLRDASIDGDTGFDPDELDRYQRGESEGWDERRNSSPSTVSEHGPTRDEMDVTATELLLGALRGA